MTSWTWWELKFLFLLVLCTSEMLRRFLTLFGLNSVPIGWRTDLDEKVEETFSCHTQSVRVRAAVASVCPYHSQMLVLRVAV